MEVPTRAELRKLKVVELRQRLSALALPQAGVKETLITKLIEHYEKEQQKQQEERSSPANDGGNEEEDGRAAMMVSIEMGDGVAAGADSQASLVSEPSPQDLPQASVESVEREGLPVTAREATPPDSPSVTPDAPTVIPDPPTVTPDAPSVTPDAPSVSPDAPSVTPDAPSVTPDAPSVTPDAPSVTPDAPSVTPDAPSVTPDVPFVTPDAPSVTPNAPSMIPDEEPEVSPEGETVPSFAPIMVEPPNVPLPEDVTQTVIPPEGEGAAVTDATLSEEPEATIGEQKTQFVTTPPEESSMISEPVATPPDTLIRTPVEASTGIEVTPTSEMLKERLDEQSAEPESMDTDVPVEAVNSAPPTSVEQSQSASMDAPGVSPSREEVLAPQMSPETQQMDLGPPQVTPEETNVVVTSQETTRPDLSAPAYQVPPLIPPAVISPATQPLPLLPPATQPHPLIPPANQPVPLLSPTIQPAPLLPTNQSIPTTQPSPLIPPSTQHAPLIPPSTQPTPLLPRSTHPAPLPPVSQPTPLLTPVSRPTPLMAKPSSNTVQDIIQAAVVSSKAKEPKQKKKKKKKRRRRKHDQPDGQRDEQENAAKEPDVEIEYVQEDLLKPGDPNYRQFHKILEAFRIPDPEELAAEEAASTAALSANQLVAQAAEKSRNAALQELESSSDEEQEKEEKQMSKKKLRKLNRLTVAQLKQLVERPDVVEMHDVTAMDPRLLIHLKSMRNTVAVPRHWSFKRKYLQGKRGIEKPPFDLPDFIKATGVMEMRQALEDKEDSKSLKQKTRERVRPKMGKLTIDYQKLHDAFFKWQTKPKMSIHGDMYYEGKEFETRLRQKKPGDLSDELRRALGMPTGLGKHKFPPPWLVAMQRYGPPPSYPNLKIPGLNAPIPENTSFGYFVGGWGKPPVDEIGRPLYGDVFGLERVDPRQRVPVEVEVDRSLWGELESEEEEDEEDDEESDKEGSPKPDDITAGLVTPMEGLVTPSGLTSIPAGLETPDMIQLRKKKIEEAMEQGGETPALYTVIPEKTAAVGGAMMGSSHVYDVAAAPSAPQKKANAVDVALDPSELDLDTATIAARYEEQVREKRNAIQKEDLSDMVAEHAAKQKKRKRTATDTGAGGKAAKKLKEFKF